MKLLFFILCVALRADVVEQDAKNAKPSGLLAGVARADISPPVGIPQMNWGAQTHVEAVGIDPAGMKATALVIGNGREKFAMVDIDILAIQKMDDIPKRASELTGIPAANIRLGSTHTHAGPLLTSVKGPVGRDLSSLEPRFWNYWSVMADKIVGAIVEANSRLEPVHVGAMKGTGSINSNRRLRAASDRAQGVGVNPDGLVDRDLAVVRIDNASGKPLAVIVNFACHGTVMAWENKVISPDWMGMLRVTVEQALPGAKCLFFQGAAGNQGPVQGFTGDLNVAHRLGSILGHEAAALALRTETVRREPKFEGFMESTAFIAKQPWRVLGPRDGTLRMSSSMIEVPRRKFTQKDVAEMEKATADAARAVEPARASGDPMRLHLAEARWRRFRDLAEQRKAPHNPDPVKVRIQALRIGEVAIVSMPGEPFAEIGIAVKKASPFPVTLFCGYSNGDGGEYMPVADEYQHGGYEVDRTPYDPAAAAEVVRRLTALVRSLQ
ncbi:MAG: neutral/alkaline non-lysosomal ceramidase N-terminal domain-containing protein [Candidatus Solibacter usitatus]|nr:neutral/alkaline non-lysosomal ceramidase N-terminal domain-containing protein [Candidatus Solibacter usitatus]